MYQQFVAGNNPLFGVVPGVLALLVIFTIYCLFKRYFRKYIDLRTSALFLAGVFSFLVLTYIQRVFYESPTFGIHFFDIYFVMPDYYPFIFFALVFAVFATTYYWFDKIFKKQMNNTLGYIHFWLSFLGLCFIIFPIHYSGMAGVPRRYYDFSNPSGFEAFINQITFVSVFAFLLVIAQLLFIFNFCYSILKKPE